MMNKEKEVEQFSKTGSGFLPGQQPSQTHMESTTQEMQLLYDL